MEPVSDHQATPAVLESGFRLHLARTPRRCAAVVWMCLLSGLILTLTPATGQTQPPDQSATTEEFQAASRKRFSELDANGNDELTSDEFTTGVADVLVETAKRNFRVFDFDASGTISPEEFRSLHAGDNASQRGAVPDPIPLAAAAAQKRFVSLLRAHDRNRDGFWDRTEWRSVANSSRFAAAALVHFETVDRQADGRLSPQEIVAAIEFAYGLHDENRLALRGADGRVFSWRAYVDEFDTDKDGVLSSDEFLSGISDWVEAGEAESITSAIDANNDYELTRAELATHGITRLDTVREFLDLDRNLDGVLETDELTANLPDWNNSFAGRLIPAFDTDDDGKLNLVEFRGTPAANPLGNWHDLRLDRDGDGRLDPDEFHNRDELRFFGLSLMFFDRLDRDGSGFLEESEYDFQFSPSAQFPELAFRHFDEDGDGLLTVEEATADVESGESEQPEGFELLVSWYADLFRRADVSGDGRLDSDEFQGSMEAALAVINQSSNRNILLGGFMERDVDGDQQLTPDEWLSGVDDDQRAANEVYAVLCDFNGDGQLQFTEYACLPGVLSPQERGPIPDPVVDEAQRAMSQVNDALGGDNAGPQSVDTAAPAIAKLVPGVTAQAVAAWDGDGDGTVTASEIRYGLDIAFGIRFADGTPLRRRGVYVFSVSTFLEWDSKQTDGALTLEEFFQFQQDAAQEYRNRVAETDADGDGKLTVSELAGKGVLFDDVFGTFLRFDSDRNGHISKQEFETNTPSWQRWLTSIVIPAFDTDGSGDLSFLEFRFCPFSNPTHRWNQQRKDDDHNGRLDPREFHAYDDLPATALSSMTFARVDGNDDGFLDLNEAEFQVDLDQVPPETAFRILDADGSGSMSIGEALSATGDADPQFLMPKHETAFRAADSNGDSELSEREFLKSNSVPVALREDRKLRRSVLPRYQSADTNGDLTVSREEWLDGIADARMGRATAEFVVCDLDGDNRLTLPEYAALPSVLDTFDRAAMPDPMAAEARRIRTELIQTLGENPDGRKLPESVSTVVQVVPGATAEIVQNWDQDGNGLLDDAEVSLGVDVGFGVRHSDGTVLRRHGGLIFSLQTFKDYDVDDDMLLSKDDIGRLGKGYGELLLKEFDQVNTDDDQGLSVRELADTRHLWRDVVGEFLRYDENTDGHLDAQELATRLPVWHQRFAQQMLPSFDENGDQSISFAEFQKCPMGSPLANWAYRRRDQDNDGLLSLDEYHPRDSSGTLRSLSGTFLARLDGNDDGVLDITELDFFVDVSRMPADAAFSFFDQNGDGRLTRQEALTADASAEGAPKIDFLLPRNAALFGRADNDGSGSVNKQEVAAVPEVMAAIVQERQIRGRVLLGFNGTDTDGNQVVSLEEWLKNIPEKDHTRASAEFHVCDFDRNASLVFAEYSALPRIVSSADRGPVPDPIVDEAGRVHSELMSELGAGTDSCLILDVQNAVAKVASSIRPDDVVGWDGDGDRKLSRDEVRLGIDVSFGIRYVDGTVLRPDNGVVFPLGTVGLWDINGDGRLSTSEFLTRHWNKDEKFQTRVKQADSDEDGYLSVAELAAAELLQIDLIGAFIRFDGNGDGEVDQREIAEHASAWDQMNLPRVIPAFDQDGNKALSFVEFRGTPYANPVVYWSIRQQRDLDGDAGLSLDEFHPSEESDQRSVAAMVLAGYDLNGNGLLDIHEWDFRFDVTRVPVEKVFELADRDADNLLTRNEVTAGFNSPAAEDLLTSTFAIARHEQAFRDADGNGDGKLDLAELKGSQAASTAVASESYLRREVLPRFAASDGDRNGRLSRDEWMRDIPADRQARRRAELSLCDFNQDGGLSFEEFTCVPGVSRVRGTVPDPIRDKVQEVRAALLAKLGPAGSGDRRIENAANIIADTLPGVTVFGTGQWDTDYDGALSDDEIGFGVDATFGMRHRGGELLRRDDGQVFLLATFQWWDANSDGLLSMSEFDLRSHYTGEQIETFVKQLDRDGNQQLSIAELEAGDVLWSDTVGEFLHYDVDGSGGIDSGEVQARIHDWRKESAEYVFPGFDTDQSGELSFAEFRLSIIADSLRNWNQMVLEIEHDARLSLEEFHWTGHWALSGLSELVFNRLDQNNDGWLSPGEARFRVQVRRLSPDQSYAMLDADANGRLSMQELSDWLRSEADPNADSEKIQSQLIHAEDAFHESDQDDDGTLSEEEYADSQVGLAAYLAGASTGQGQQAAADGPLVPANDGGDWNPRTILLMLINTVLVGGLVWFLFVRDSTATG